MPYTPENINTGDPITASWGNKIEQELALIGNYMGKVNTKDDLPESPETGDFYLVLDKASFYLWNGTKWKTIGGSQMMLAANEDALTVSGSAWCGIKGFTLMIGPDVMNQLSAHTIATTSPSSVTAQLRLMIFDYSGDTPLVTGSAYTVQGENIFVQFEELDISTLTPSAGYIVSMQGSCASGSVTTTSTEFIGG